jgi:hypothetical protein
MIDVYEQNTNLSHPSLPSLHGSATLFSSPDEEVIINPTALEIYLKFRIHAELGKTVLREKVKEMSKTYGVPQSASNGSMVICLQSCFNYSKNPYTITMTPKEMARKRTRTTKSVEMHLNNVDMLEFYEIDTIVSQKGKKVWAISHAITSPLHPQFTAFLTLIRTLHKRQKLEIFSKIKEGKSLVEADFRVVKSSYTYNKREKDKSFSTHTGAQANTRSEEKYQEKIEKNKNVTKIVEEEKKVASGLETSSATSEQPEDPIAMKLTECEATPEPSSSPEQPQDRTAMKPTGSSATPEPLSETTEQAETIRTENTQENKIQAEQTETKKTLTTNTPEARKTLWDKKRAEREKKQEEARKHGYRKLRKPGIEEMIQQAWVYFVSLFQLEGSAPSLVCSELDFKICLSAKIPRLFYGIAGFKKYLDAIFTNEYLMGRRRMSNGNFWVLQLGAMLSEKTYDQYLNQSGLFRPSNYIVFSKKEEASVPQNLLEKLNFSSEQLETVCEVINDHLHQTKGIVNDPLQHLEAQLVDKSASPLTTKQLEKLMMDRPVKEDVDSSESSEKAEKIHEMNKTTQGEEKLTGDIFSPFDEVIKKHLLKVLSYNTYKAWMIDAEASFEEAEFGWKVTANRQFSKNQIETKFGQFIDEACRNYVHQKM